MQNFSSRVFSFFYIGIDTEAGVTNAQFEAFVRDKGVHLPIYPGWRWTLLRGLRGERTDQYLMLFEMKNAEARDLYVDENVNPTALAQQFWQDAPEAQEILEVWKHLATFAELPTLFTDYRLLAENNKSTVKPGPRYHQGEGGDETARIIGIHNLALRKGVTPAEFESFIAKNHHRIEDYPGWKFHLLKGERGNRLDQYVVMMEIESVAALTVFYPEADIGTQETDKFAQAHRDTKQMYEEWKKLASFSGSPQIYTDYISVAECGTCD